MSKRNPNLVLDVDESPKKLSQWLILSLQHILAMFVACITVPLIVYGPYMTTAGESLAHVMIAPTLVSAGLGTIFYLIMTKMKSPVFLASSFAYIAPMTGALALTTTNGTQVPNLWILPIGMAFVGVVYITVAIIIKFFGVDWLNKLLPPIVVGPVIMVIGLSLAGSAVGNMDLTITGQNYNLVAVFCGLVATFVTALCAHYGKKRLNLIPFVIGILAGYIVASIFTGIGYYGCGNEYYHIVHWEPLIKNFTYDPSSEIPMGLQVFTSFLDYPRFLFLNKQYLEGVQPITGAMVGQAAALFIPVAFVTICEHIGDHENLGTILDKDLLKDPGLSRTLIGDGVATSISGLCCGAANTTYGENVAVIGVTKIASSKVVLNSAIMAICIAFLKPLMCLAMTIPTCVTGGVSLILYGFIASSGVKMLMKYNIDMGKTKNIFVAATILVSGIGGLAFRFGNPANPSVTITSVAVAMVLGILMNVVLVEKKDDNKKQTKIERAIEEEETNLD